VEHEENQHLDIREKLLRLPKLQADDNFLKRLQIQIDILDAEEKTRDVVVKGSVSGYFKNLFGARLVPALGISSVVVAAFLVYFLLADKKDAVVNNMTNNKTTETVITREQPETTTTTPSQPNTGNDLAKNEEPKTKETETEKKKPVENQQEYNLNNLKPEPKKSAEEKSFSQDISNIKSNTAIDVNQSGRTIEPAPPIVSSERKSEEQSKIQQQKDVEKPSAPITSADKEKTINEGGRGKTDTNTGKNPQSSPKPKKKSLDGVIDINKSVLETLRDKLK
jgi:hypothetical protein